MGSLKALLKLQALDLEADGLRARREDLQEARELEGCLADVAELDGALAAIRERRQVLAKAEHALDIEVEGVAAKAKSVEDKLYSGTVNVPKELEALQEDLQMLRRRQGELEDLELEQLEAIEGVEGELSERETTRSDAGARAAELEIAVRTTEDEIRAKLTGIGTAHAEEAARLPGPILEAYTRLRGNPRLAGRVVALLGDGMCEGCRIQLPTREYSRIRSEPLDAVVSCSGCGRLLVR
jgi:predicted  nucleic acid-binding Zn-ribbon protein